MAAIKIPGAAAAKPAPIDATPSAADESAVALPNAIDVDPAKITTPTLTRQGWVMPIERPAAPRG